MPTTTKPQTGGRLCLVSPGENNHATYSAPSFNQQQTSICRAAEVSVAKPCVRPGSTVLLCTDRVGCKVPIRATVAALLPASPLALSCRCSACNHAAAPRARKGGKEPRKGFRCQRQWQRAQTVVTSMALHLWQTDKCMDVGTSSPAHSSCCAAWHNMSPEKTLNLC